MASGPSNSVTDFARDLLLRTAATGNVGDVAKNLQHAGEATEALAPSVSDMIPREPPGGFSRDEVTSVAHKVLAAEDMSPRERFVTEAIIIPELRPAVLVRGDDFEMNHHAWGDFAKGTPAHANLIAAMPSVGRIEIVGNPAIPYGGTGFLVTPDLVMTNRHVAQLVVSGVGNSGLRFLDQLGAGIDFGREQGQPEGTPFDVIDVALVHPYWDLALLRVAGLEGRKPIKFCSAEPDPSAATRVAVIGYPAFDPRNDPAVQDQVFGGVYNVKRLQPGLLGHRRDIGSFGKLVSAATHDSSTLGGNSGSVVLDAASGLAVGLHFAGIYMDTNFAVPASDLAREQRLIDAGLVFEPASESGSGPWDAHWSGLEVAAAEARTPLPPATDAQAHSDVRSSHVRVVVPVEVELSVAVIGARVCAEPYDAAVDSRSRGELHERMVEPFHEPAEQPREGYDANFLGLPVPMPTPRRREDCASLADGSIVLKYHHFSVVMHAQRRLALFTASNVEASSAAKQPESGRSYTRAGLSGLADGDIEKWFIDPRIRGTEQLPDRFFTKDRKAFDKGHLVRREDVAWGGSYDEVRRANGDTYFVTNCSPQTSAFNRSNRRDNWGALEDIVLRQARVERYCVIAGPMLADDDPSFSGTDDMGAVSVRIPRRYWKVIVAREEEGGLKTFGFMLAQDLSDVAMEFAVPETWAPHMVRLRELEAELGSLDFPASVLDADQFDVVRAGAESPALIEAAARIKAMADAAADEEGPMVDRGRFVGLPLRVEFDTDADSRRHAHLLSTLSYVGPDHAEWSVPVGSRLDGASIPQAFWSVIGGPFEGLYLEASVVHDFYCDDRGRPWRAVHRMFYDAMLCRGVSGFKARIMFYAVYRFGPRWESTEGIFAAAPAERIDDSKAPSILADAEAIAKMALTVEQIEALADASAPRHPG